VVRCGAVCCSVLQFVLQCVAGAHVQEQEAAREYMGTYMQTMTCVAVCCSVLQFIAACCSVLQFVYVDKDTPAALFL